MTIIEALKKENIRVTGNGKTLYFDESNNEWVVVRFVRGKSINLYSGPEEGAVAELLED